MAATRAFPDDTRSPSLREAIRTLEEDIIFGRLLPRERLIEETLMVRLGAKRHVVRQALAELGKLGIVVHERNRGARVRDFSPSEVEQIYEMRALLQGHAAERIPLPCDDDVLRRLTEIHAQHADAVERGDLRAVHRLNNAFHDVLFGACGNPYLTDAIAHYAWLAHAIRSYRMADPVRLRQARDEHARMIAALYAGDRAGLVSLCVEHIQPSKLVYLAQEALRQSAAV